MDLSLEDEVGTDLVGGTGGGDLVKALGVESETEVCLDTRAKGLGVAEAEDTSVVDLGLDESSIIKVSLGADLKVDVLGGALGVVGGLSTGLDVRGDAVVVRCREEVQVVETLEGNSVLWRAEANGRGVASHLALSDVVGSLSTKQEAIAANYGIGSEGRALEEVKESAGVETRLLVGGGDKSTLAGAVGSERGVKVKLETLSKVVLCLDLSAEEVGGGPSLCEDEAVGLVGVLGLKLAANEVSLVVLLPRDLEGDVGRGDSLDLEAGAREVEVAAQKVSGRLAKILPGWGDGLRERHGWRCA